MLRIPSIVLSLVAVLLLAGCASDSGGDGAPTWNDTHEVFGEARVPAAAAGTAKLVFLRPGSEKAGSVANVYVSDRFLSSLLPGGYVVHQVCAGSVKVATVIDDAALRHAGRQTAERAMPIEAGGTYYFMVGSAGDRGTLERLDAAKVNLANFKGQVHGLSRAPSSFDGMQVAATPAPVAVPAPVLAPKPAAPRPAAPKPAPCPYADKAPPVARASAGLGEVDVSYLRCAVETWRATWQSGDYAVYEAQYDLAAHGSKSSQRAWQDLRRKRLKNTDKQIVLGPISMSERGDIAVTEFEQDYRAKEYRDLGTKRLLWKRAPGDAAGWRIVGEEFEAAAKKK